MKFCRNLALTLIDVLRPWGAAGCAWFAYFNFFFVLKSSLPRNPQKTGFRRKNFFLVTLIFWTKISYARKSALDRLVKIWDFYLKN